LTTRHLAAKCEAPNTCSMCGKEHKTAECTESENDKFWCVNCKELGHASWDHLHPCFLEAGRWLEITDPEHTYRFFPSQEPWTWEQAPPESGPYPARWKNMGGTPTQDVDTVCDQGPNYTRGPTDHPSMYMIEHNNRFQPGELPFPNTAHHTGAQVRPQNHMWAPNVQMWPIDQGWGSRVGRQCWMDKLPQESGAAETQGADTHR